MEKTEPIEEGLDAAIVCNTYGHPTPTIEWYKNGNMLDPEEKTEAKRYMQFLFNADKLLVFCLIS